MIVINGAIITRDGDEVRSVLRDGKIVSAAPHDTEAYGKTAQEYGYGDDVALMNVEHDLMHHVLAKALGRPESVVLRAVADDNWQTDETGLLAAEEQAVLAMQKFSRLLGVNLWKSLSK